MARGPVLRRRKQSSRVLRPNWNAVQWPRVFGINIIFKHIRSFIVSANSRVDDDDFLDMIASIQGSRMDDQRADAASLFPGLHNSPELMRHFADSAHGITSSEGTAFLDDEQFFETLMRCQVRRCGLIQRCYKILITRLLRDWLSFSLTKSSVPLIRRISDPHIWFSLLIVTTHALHLTSLWSKRLYHSKSLTAPSDMLHLIFGTSFLHHSEFLVQINHPPLNIRSFEHAGLTYYLTLTC